MEGGSVTFGDNSKGTIIGIEIEPLGEDMERLSLKDSSAQEEKQESISDVQEDKEKSSQPLPKDWRLSLIHI